MAFDPTYRAKAQEYLTMTRRWRAELDSWAIELMFLQRMLDIYGLKAEDGPQMERLRSLRKAMGDFITAAIEELRSELGRHDEHLSQITEDKLLLQDKEMPYRHADVEHSIRDARSAYHGIQSKAFLLIDELKLG